MNKLIIGLAAIAGIYLIATPSVSIKISAVDWENKFASYTAKAGNSASGGRIYLGENKGVGGVRISSVDNKIIITATSGSSTQTKTIDFSTRSIY